MRFRAYSASALCRDVFIFDVDDASVSSDFNREEDAAAAAAETEDDAATPAAVGRVPCVGLFEPGIRTRVVGGWELKDGVVLLGMVEPFGMK